MEFSEWLEGELKNKGWIPADLTREAGVDSGVVSRLLSGERKPKPETLQLLSKALGIKDEDVFRAAGLLKPKKANERAERLLYQIDQLDDQDQETIETLVGALLEKSRKKNTVPKSTTT